MKKTPRFCLILFVSGLFLSGLMFHTLKIHDDHVQILEKVYKLNELGVWSHFGNRGTGVGFLPGSANTFLTAIPMKIWNSPHAAGLVILIFHLLSLFLLRRSQRLIAPTSSLVLILLLFWINPWRLEQMELYNPAYLFLFATVHLWSSLNMKTKNFWMTTLHVMSLGFCVQFHFSAIILGICSLLLFYFKWYRVHWAGFALGTTVSLLSLVPWALAYLNQPELGLTVADPNKAFLGRNFLYIYPVLKAISYWVRYGSTYFARHIFTEVEFTWIQIEWLKLIVQWVFDTVKWVLAAFTFWVSLKWNYKSIQKTWVRKKFKRATEKLEMSDSERFHLYFFYLFIGLVISAGLSPVEFNHWHLILCFPTVILMISLKLDLRLKRLSEKKQLRWLALLTTVFLIFSTFAALDSRTHSWTANFHDSVQEFFNSKTTL